jgi:hypothetical protein
MVSDLLDSSDDSARGDGSMCRVRAARARGDARVGSRAARRLERAAIEAASMPAMSPIPKRGGRASRPTSKKKRESEARPLPLREGAERRDEILPAMSRKDEGKERKSPDSRPKEGSLYQLWRAYRRR